jgi:hypothetical protein
MTQALYAHMNNKTIFKKRNEILTHATTWLNLEDIVLSELSQRRRTKLHDSSGIVSQTRGSR